MAKWWQRFRRHRAREASPGQLVATGAYGGLGFDPDGDVGFRPYGQLGGRPVPVWTLEKARAYSTNAYRANPMGRAILDTYTSFCVGDTGLSLQCSSDEVRPIAEDYWYDPKNRFAEQDVALRSHLINGETVYEVLEGETTGVVRRSVIDPARIKHVRLLAGNPLWPSALVLPGYVGVEDRELTIVDIDELSGLRQGEAHFWASFRALETDTRGFPFLGPVLDWLDSYDQVLSNLIDRTALARHIAFDVTLKKGAVGGATQDVGPDEINQFIRDRGGKSIPKSGTIEVHNESVEWKPLEAKSNADEDTQTVRAVTTSVAAGAGLSKPWLAEPEDANRATSLSMAEPVRRRVGGVQKLWLHYQHEHTRHAIDRAVAAGRLPAEVEIAAEGGQKKKVRPSETITITGPEVAAADAAITAEVLTNLGQALTSFVAAGLLSKDAGRIAVQKGWEQFTGMPFPTELAAKDDAAGALGDTDPDKVADRLDDAGATAPPVLTSLRSA